MNSISDNWNDNLQSLDQEKNEASVPAFYADCTPVPVSQTSSLRGLDVGFIPPLPKKLPYMANNDEYNDEYLCRDFFVGFIFWPKLSFQISEFRVHWTGPRNQTWFIFNIVKLKEIRKKLHKIITLSILHIFNWAIKYMFLKSFIIHEPLTKKISSVGDVWKSEE